MMPDISGMFSQGMDSPVAGSPTGGGFMDKAGSLFTNPSFLYLLSSLGQALSTPGGYPDALSKMGMGLSQNIMGQEMLKQLLNSLKGGAGGGTSGLGGLGPSPVLNPLESYQFGGQPKAPVSTNWLDMPNKPIPDFAPF